jgi:alanine racemase
MAQVAPLVLEAGADWLCVNNIDEAQELRGLGLEAPLLVMGYTPLDRLADVVEHDVRQVVYNRRTLERLAELAEAAGKRVPVHLKVETGTYRQGVAEEHVPEMVGLIAGSRSLLLEGLTTHFANIEDTTDHGFAETQMAVFGRIEDGLAGAGYPVPIRHTACSAAALLFTRTHMDLVRLGISLYGLWPSKETYVSCLELGKPALDLCPALTWKTRVAQVKEVPEDSSVSYGCTFRTTRPSRMAVLPVGYYEGYDRAFSNRAYVLIGGRRAPVRGRVCMNMTLVDITDIPDVALEDEVVLLGRQGGEVLRAEQLAEWCGTIAYEIVARIHGGLPRVVV